MVGTGSPAANVGQTGGANGHSHTLSNNGWARIAIPTNPRIDMQTKSGVTGWNSTDSVTGAGTYSSTASSRGAGAVLDGATDTNTDTRPPWLSGNVIIKI